ncbi:unnamed protein product [Brachionus calyciflorus]|uniref:Uncharacterized protein n=1 Tax=Brachionus calyciflorus TaxID=104777 RepID=A0A813WFG1_9BILA|nr:unnamed protein product [Brachionus calyciflorus]
MDSKNCEQKQSSENVFEIAAKAEKLLKEILSSNKNSNILNAVIKQEPQVQQQQPVQEPVQVQPPPRPPAQIPQPYYQQYQQLIRPPIPTAYYYHHQNPNLVQPQQILVDPSYFVNNPPPMISQPRPPYYYQQPQAQVQPPQTVYYQSYQSIRPPVVYNQPRPNSYIQSAPVHYNYQANKRKNNDSENLDDPDSDEDLNIIRERELNELKSKSIMEKMNVFIKYYKQFSEAYIQRVHMLECSDGLKLQFSSLIKYLHEYDMVLQELHGIILEHERDFICKNNHRKTKKFFNKTKAFIRYECSKRLQSNIFEYRRMINSQDRYAGMYDLLDMNNHLISLIPEIGVSIRRYINKCEKARQEELNPEDEDYWNSDCSNDENSGNEKTTYQNNDGDLSIPSFKEFCQNHDENLEKENNDYQTPVQTSSKSFKNYESYSKGIDSLNRYLLKRVDEEESLDELVKERIIKWINKRQAKYILIFSEVDKLLNQHKAVTVCESYHQKLKELLYSTTIRRKKKRKKVKILPEAMTDVFDEINDLKKGLEYGKVLIKKCNYELKLAAAANAASTANTTNGTNTNAELNGRTDFKNNLHPIIFGLTSHEQEKDFIEFYNGARRLAKKLRIIFTSYIIKFKPQYIANENESEDSSDQETDDMSDSDNGNEETAKRQKHGRCLSRDNFFLVVR